VSLDIKEGKHKSPHLHVQGSNAHVVMEVCSNDAPPSVTTLPSHIWQRDRHWFCPAAHALLTYCKRLSGSAGRTFFTCLLSHPALAYLGDYRMKGMQSIPAAVPLEVGLPSHLSHLFLLIRISRAAPSCGTMIILDTEAWNTRGE